MLEGYCKAKHEYERTKCNLILTDCEVASVLRREGIKTTTQETRDEFLKAGIPLTFRSLNEAILAAKRDHARRTGDTEVFKRSSRPTKLG